MKLVDVTYAIGGVPLIYDRDKSKGYGVPVEDVTFRATPEMNERLGELGEYFKIILGWANVSGILCGGTYPGRGTGSHARGEAVDLDGIMTESIVQREGHPCYYVPLTYGESSNPAGKMTQKLKTRVACACRKVFPVVLGDYYDKAHHDHLHVALSYSSGDRPRIEFNYRNSETKLLQATLNAWGKIHLFVDGKFGPKTRGALQAALQLKEPFVVSDRIIVNVFTKKVIEGTL